MQNTITKNKFILSTILVLITLLEILLINKIPYSNQLLRYISFMVLFNIFFKIISMKLLGMKYKSFFFLFIMLLYLFHFGQVVCCAFLPKLPSNVTNMIESVITDEDFAIELFTIMIITINCIFLGGMLYHSNEILTTSHKHRYNEYKICKNMAIIILLISTPLRFYIDIRQLIAAYEEGYSGAASVTTSGIITAIAGFWYLGVLFFILTVDDIKKRKRIVSMIFIYMIITMFTGNRGHQLVNILGIILVLSLKNDNKISLIKTIKYTIIAFLGLVIINLIFKMRILGISYLFENFGPLLLETLQDNLLIQTVFELGASIKTPYLIISGMESKINPFFGETFLRSSLTIFPNIGGILTNNNNAAIIGRVLNEAYGIGSLGGSFIGELYYNFKGFYWIFAILFGIIYYKLSFGIGLAIKYNNQVLICKTLPFLIYSLWWVRDSFCGLFRPVIWLLIIYWCARHIKLTY